MPKKNLSTPAKNLGLFTTTIFICTSLSLFANTLLSTPEQPYSRCCKRKCQKNKHELGGQETQADKRCGKQYYRRFAFAFVVPAPHLIHTTFTAFYSATEIVLQIKATPHNYRPSGFVGTCLQIFRHFCQKLLEIRQYSCVVFGNLTKNLTAQSLDNNCAVLP